MELNEFERLEDLQCDGLKIIQDTSGYMFTSDAVELANFVTVPKNGKVVDLCSGSGIIGILVSAKNSVSSVVLVELQKSLAEMSKKSIEYNGLQNFTVVNQPLQGVHKVLGQGVFDTVVCNPPYKKVGSAGLLSKTEAVAIAKHEITVTLEEIVCEASKLLRFGGEFFIVNKEERLTDLMVVCRKYGMEPKILKILPSSKGASIILLKAKKGGKSGLSIRLD